jgi:hypothetical protein
LSKLGLVDGLRRVPDGRILLAEMGEARRSAQKRLAEMRMESHGAAQRTADALHELVEQLSANYHELETAVSGRVQLSREVLNRWQDETRSLMRELSRISSMRTA